MTTIACIFISEKKYFFAYLDKGKEQRFSWFYKNKVQGREGLASEFFFPSAAMLIPCRSILGHGSTGETGPGGGVQGSLLDNCAPWSGLLRAFQRSRLACSQGSRSTFILNTVAKINVPLKSIEQVAVTVRPKFSKKDYIILPKDFFFLPIRN